MFEWELPFTQLPIGKAEKLKTGTEIAVLSLGTVANNVSKQLIP